MKSCDQVNSENKEKYDASTLICGIGSCGNDKNTCATHGKDFIGYKGRYCCKQDVWFYFGNTHYYSQEQMKNVKLETFSHNTSSDEKKNKTKDLFLRKDIQEAKAQTTMKNENEESEELVNIKLYQLESLQMLGSKFQSEF